MKQQLIYTVGLPGSGKSTWAREQQAKDPSIVLVSRDEIRSTLHTGKHTRGNEAQVIRVQNDIIHDSLRSGRSVIVHDTNLNPDNVIRFTTIVSHYPEVELVRFDLTDVPIEKCVERDLARGKAAGVVGAGVIKRMYRDYLQPKPEVAPYNSVLDEAIIVDMDGTLAIIGDRSPYDTSGLCLSDPWNVPVMRLVKAQLKADPSIKLIICSGREELVREPTEQWLANADLPVHALYMRSTGDKSKDAIVKRAIYDSHIRGKYNVLYVLDDRNQVVDLWRSLGLTCLQVAPGDF